MLQAVAAVMILVAFFALIIAPFVLLRMLLVAVSARALTHRRNKHDFDYPKTGEVVNGTEVRARRGSVDAQGFLTRKLRPQLGTEATNAPSFAGGSPVMPASLKRMSHAKREATIKALILADIEDAPRKADQARADARWAAWRAAQ